KKLSSMHARELNFNKRARLCPVISNLVSPHERGGTMEKQMQTFRAILVAVILSTGMALAQTSTASLLGIARDASGAVIPGATVTATNTGTTFTRTVTTDGTGAYLITNLPVGAYTLTVEKAGFRKFVQQGITLNVNDQARVDVAMVIGDTTESVSVTAEATGVDTQSTSMG